MSVISPAAHSFSSSFLPSPPPPPPSMATSNTPISYTQAVIIDTLRNGPPISLQAMLQGRPMPRAGPTLIDTLKLAATLWNQLFQQESFEISDPQMERFIDNCRTAGFDLIGVDLLQESLVLLKSVFGRGIDPEFYITDSEMGLTTVGLPGKTALEHIEAAFNGQARKNRWMQEARAQNAADERMTRHIDKLTIHLGRQKPPINPTIDASSLMSRLPFETRTQIWEDALIRPSLIILEFAQGSGKFTFRLPFFEHLDFPPNVIASSPESRLIAARWGVNTSSGKSCSPHFPRRPFHRRQDIYLLPVEKLPSIAKPFDFDALIQTKTEQRGPTSVAVSLRALQNRTSMLYHVLTNFSKQVGPVRTVYIIMAWAAWNAADNCFDCSTQPQVPGQWEVRRTNEGLLRWNKLYKGFEYYYLNLNTSQLYTAMTNRGLSMLKDIGWGFADLERFCREAPGGVDEMAVVPAFAIRFLGSPSDNNKKSKE